MFTRMIRSRRGQGMAEYAILFAIVLGAAIAMRQFLKSRFQGTVAALGDTYSDQANILTGKAVAGFDPNRNTTSNASTEMNMTTAKAGIVAIDSESGTTAIK